MIIMTKNNNSYPAQRTVNYPEVRPRSYGGQTHIKYLVGVPDDFTGQSGKYLIVSTDETELEFGAGGGGSSVSWHQEQLIDNSAGGEASVSLTYTPEQASSVLLFFNGVFQKQGPGLDYTISGKVITFTPALEAGWNVATCYSTSDI